MPNANRGSKWFDLCGRNHGTLTNMDPATDWLGPQGRPGGFGCLDFDGSDDRVVLDNTFDLTGSFSVAAWLFPRSFNFCVTSDNPGNDQNTLWISGSASVIRPAGTNLSAITDPDFVTGEWQHSVWTRNSSDLFEAWRNGTKVGERASSSGTITLGAIGRSASLPTDGLIDSLLAYDRVLSASEVAALYQDSLAGHPRMLNWIEPRYYVSAPAAGNRRRRVIVGAA